MIRQAVLIGLAAATLSACAPAVPLIGGGAVLTRSVLQERSTRAALIDTEIGLGIAGRLATRSGELYRDVSIDVVEGAVLLTGTVPRRADKVAATQEAWATPRVVAVEDQIGVSEDSGTRAYLDDVAIANRLRYALLADRRVTSVNYNVTVIDRVVHLTGLARSRSELARVIERARRTEGVSRVVSHVLTIDDPRRVTRVARDG